jgi:hypothetical protein
MPPAGDSALSNDATHDATRLCLSAIQRRVSDKPARRVTQSLHHGVVFVTELYRFGNLYVPYTMATDTEPPDYR